MIATHFPVLQVILPLIAAPIMVLARRGAIAWLLAVIVSWAGLFISLALLARAADGSVISYAIGNWPPPWGIEYRIDRVNAFLLTLVSLISAVVVVYSRLSVAAEVPRERHYLFYALYSLCLAGLLGITITGDAFNLFVFLEIASLSSYVLIALGRDRRALMAAYQYLIMGTIGATFIVIGVGLLYLMTGTLNMADMAVRLRGVTEVRPVLAALACWYPKWSGRALDERATRTATWMLGAGAVVAFAPLLRLGLLGMPPRVYTYAAGQGWSALNALAGAGVLLTGAGLVLAGRLLAQGRKRGRRVGANPWQGGTLEWSAPSPPPPYNFTYVPAVEQRYPLWTSAAPPPGTALGTDQRWALVTSPRDARPWCATRVAGDSIWPLALAAVLAATLMSAVPVPITMPLGAALIALVTLRWRGEREREVL